MSLFKGSSDSDAEELGDVEAGDEMTIVIPTAADDDPVLIPMAQSDEEAKPFEGVTEDLIDWFLNPEGPSPEASRAAENSSPTPQVATSGPAPITPMAPLVRHLPDRFDRPPLPEDLLQLKRDAQLELSTHIGERMGANIGEDQLEELVITVLAEFLDEQDTSAWNEEQLDQLAEELLADILGHGPIQTLLDDPTVSEIMVNSTKSVFVERAGRLHKTTLRFTDDEQVMRIIDLIVSRVGRRIDESSPMVDARLPDGSRVNAIIPPLAVDGPMLTIRKFSKNAITTQDLVAYQTLNWDAVALLRAAVYGRLNIVISGGTGTGKTTMLNVCSGFIPETERVVTIEDSVELRLDQEHVIRLESRPSNIEGTGEIPIRQLVRNSLRMRPDRIVVGECRGGEAIDMLQAMNTGHEGSLTTLHANSPRDAIARLETMVMMAGMDLPIRAIREQISAAVDMIVHIDRMRDGSRRVTKISEVVGMEGDTITTSDIFMFEADGIDEHGRFIGELRPTGIRPSWTEKLALQGIELRASTFGDTTIDSLAP